MTAAGVTTRIRDSDDGRPSRRTSCPTMNRAEHPGFEPRVPERASRTVRLEQPEGVGQAPVEGRGRRRAGEEPLAPVRARGERRELRLEVAEHPCDAVGIEHPGE